MSAQDEQAFPCDIANTSKESFWLDGIEIPPGSKAVATGMTLRDYFAAKAMQSFVADRKIVADYAHAQGVDDPVAVIATLSYEYADAMLAARAA